MRTKRFTLGSWAAASSALTVPDIVPGDHVVRIWVQGEDCCGMDDGRDAFDSSDKGALCPHIRHGHQLEIAGTILLIE